jgi:hypothetical protein
LYKQAGFLCVIPLNILFLTDIIKVGSMKLIKFIVFIGVLFLSACTVEQYVTVPVNYNAKLTFPDSTKILLINQFDVSKAKITNPKKLKVIKAAAYTSVKYAETRLKKLPKVRVINLVDSVNFNVNTDSIKLLALKYHVNYVLALKNFTADIVIGGVDNGTAYYNTTAEVNFMLFQNDGIYFKKLNGKVSDPQSEGSGLIGSMVFRPTVRGNRSSVNFAAQHATEDALQEYLPSGVVHDRPLYNDVIFQPAIQAILARKFDKADSLLTPILKDNSILNQCKAAYNLSVVYEAEGDIDGAIEMAELSNQKYKNMYALAILEDLKTE